MFSLHRISEPNENSDNSNPKHSLALVKAMIKWTDGTRKSHVKIENLYLKNTQVFIGGRYFF